VLKFELERQKAEIQTKIKELCGDNFNGTIHSAYCGMNAAPKNTAEFEAAKAEFDKLCAELESLAVWTGSHITGGKFHEIETKLANVDIIARGEALKLGQFYAELCREARPGQEDARSIALHNIIG